MAKAAVINSLSCPDARRGYRHAIHEFVDWYCSEPRLSFSKTVVVRYRERTWNRGTSPQVLSASASVRCAALHTKRQAADFSARIWLQEYVASKGVKKRGVRFGNWLTPEQAQSLWQVPDLARLRGKRDCALLAILLACGLRRHEIAELTGDHQQQRKEHWAVVELAGKGTHSNHPGTRLVLQRIERLDGRSGRSSRKALPKGEQRGQTCGTE